MGENERYRRGSLALFQDEMYRDAIADLEPEMRIAVDLRLLLAPVEATFPVLDQIF
jgi:hypothetical protein